MFITVLRNPNGSEVKTAYIIAGHQNNDCRVPALRSPLMDQERMVLTSVLLFLQGKEKERKEVYLYSAFIVATTLKALRRGSHSFTCK